LNRHVFFPSFIPAFDLEFAGVILMFNIAPVHRLTQSRERPFGLLVVHHMQNAGLPDKLRETPSLSRVCIIAPGVG
jgi:hypothetical protein